jgi:hypothetical protein
VGNEGKEIKVCKNEAMAENIENINVNKAEFREKENILNKTLM